jgi:hypothetical protein
LIALFIKVRFSRYCESNNGHVELFRAHTNLNLPKKEPSFDLGIEEKD